MPFNHPEKVANKCKHVIHSSSSAHTPWCTDCTASAAKEDLERVQRAFEAEGGPGAPAYMRDYAWNVARLRFAVKSSRVNKLMQYGWLRRERERVWEEAHQQHLPEAGDEIIPTTCVVCDATKSLGLTYANPIIPLTTAWWEREGALVAVQIPLPRSPLRVKMSTKDISKPRSKLTSCLRDFIQSCREMRNVSDSQRQAWQDHCKLERAIRRKYNLANDYDIDPEFLAFPIPASHARYHHRRTQNGLSAGERRANRHKRRAEGFKPSCSSLALSELAENIILNDTELKRLRSVEEAAELRRLETGVAAEVGYLYFIGEFGLLEKWKEDVERSNQSLIYRKHAQGFVMVQIDEDQSIAKGGEELGLYE